jgi:hypothetical protein
VKLIALEEAFWYDKLATDGTPVGRVPVKAAAELRRAARPPPGSTPGARVIAGVARHEDLARESRP